MHIFSEYPGIKTHSVLTGVISHAELTKKYMKCANNYNQQQQQKKKRKHDSSHQSGRSANHLTTSTMAAKHLDWIKQVAIKGSCNSYDGGTMFLRYLQWRILITLCL